MKFDPMYALSHVPDDDPVDDVLCSWLDDRDGEREWVVEGEKKEDPDETELKEDAKAILEALPIGSDVAMTLINAMVIFDDFLPCVRKMK